MKSEFNNLGQIMGCYFHQDWPYEFDNDIDVLQTIVKSEPREKIIASINEIDELLLKAPPEDELKTILLEEIGCYFEPSSQEITCKQWLKRVREIFSKTL